MVGKIKFAPGTFASFITCLIFLLLIDIIGFAFLFFITLLIFCYSFFAINNTFDKYDADDPQEIVIDEFVGQMLPLLVIPVYETLYPLPIIYYCLPSFFLLI